MNTVNNLALVSLIDLAVEDGAKLPQNYKLRCNWPGEPECCKKSESTGEKSDSKGEKSDSKSEKSDATIHLKSDQMSLWLYQFKKLVKFHERNGHCNVPTGSSKDPVLARWVKRQRYQYKLLRSGSKSSNMTPRRIQLLESIGFVWELRVAIWNQRFQELVAFKEANGHFNVPASNQKLSIWVKCQRRQHRLFLSGRKPSNMTIDRIEALNSIGFVWGMRK
eukprot:scaffold2811_cov102-Cylindrotheca_fusiformis.AAC.6